MLLNNLSCCTKNNLAQNISNAALTNDFRLATFSLDLPQCAAERLLYHQVTDCIFQPLRQIYLARGTPNPRRWCFASATGFMSDADSSSWYCSKAGLKSIAPLPV